MISSLFCCCVYNLILLTTIYSGVKRRGLEESCVSLSSLNTDPVNTGTYSLLCIFYISCHTMWLMSSIVYCYSRFDCCNRVNALDKFLHNRMLTLQCHNKGKENTIPHGFVCHSLFINYSIH